MPAKSEKSELENLFFRDKPARLLVHIKKEHRSYASVLSRQINATYAHTKELLDRMHSLGLVTFSKTGRTKYVTLTPAGKDLAEHFEALIFKRMGSK